MSSLFVRRLVNLVSLKIAQTYKWNSSFLIAYKSACKLLTFLMMLASLPLSLHLRVTLDIHWQWLLLRKGGTRKVHQQRHPWPCLASTTYRVKPPKNLVKALPFTPHLRIMLDACRRWSLLKRGSTRKIHQVHSQQHPWPCLVRTTYLGTSTDQA